EGEVEGDQAGGKIARAAARRVKERGRQLLGGDRLAGELARGAALLNRLAERSAGGLARRRERGEAADRGDRSETGFRALAPVDHLGFPLETGVGVGLDEERVVHLRRRERDGGRA